MRTALLDFHRITSWTIVHEECQREFGFLAFYGKKINAWNRLPTHMTEGVIAHSKRP